MRDKCTEPGGAWVHARAFVWSLNSQEASGPVNMSGCISYHIIQNNHDTSRLCYYVVSFSVALWLLATPYNGEYRSRTRQRGVLSDKGSSPIEPMHQRAIGLPSLIITSEGLL